MSKPLKELFTENPDLVARIFEYIVSEFPQIAEDREKLEKAEEAVRAEFGGEETYIQKRDRQALASDVLRLFNGRNATEVARRLGIHRATVYRYLKQPGK